MANLEDEVLLGSVSVDVRRAFNSRAKHTRLPTELWEHIWRLLSLVDRVSVSQVCFYWRTIALASLWLWVELDIGYCKTHPMFPACVKCRCHTDEVASPDLNLLTLVLPRSKDLPLSLRFRSTESTRRRMLDLLAGATHRLTGVEIDAVPGPDARDSHLAHFCSMHSIRTLRLNRLSNGWDDFRPDNFDLPNLEHLHISYGTIHDGVRAPLLNLTSLHFSFSTLDEILKYLKAAPQLSELSLDAGDVEKHELNHWTNAESNEIRSSVAYLSRIRVIGILPDATKRILEMFHIAPCPDLSFGYGISTDSSMAVFEDMEQPVHLSLTEDKTTLVARARGGCGRTRQVSDHYGTFAPFTAGIAAHIPAVHMLSIDYPLVLFLVHSVPWCSTTESLTLYFRDRVHAVASRAGTLLTGTWSRLRSLTLEAADDGYTTLPGSVVTDLVKLISPAGGLEKVVLRGIYTDAHSDTELAALASTVVANGRCVLRST